MIWEIMMTPDRKALISVSSDKTIRLWDVETGDLINTIRGQIGEGRQGMLYAGAISPDGQIVAVGGYGFGVGKSYIHLFHLQTGKQVGLLKGHSNTIHALAFSQDGKWLASSSHDQTIRIWQISSLNSSPDKMEYREVALLKGHRGPVYDVAFSPDGTKLVSASLDGTLRLWEFPQDLPDAENLEGIKYTEMTQHSAEAYCVAYAPNGKHIISGGFDRKILLWDEQGQFIKEIDELPYFVTVVSFSADSQKIVASDQSGRSVEIYAIPTGEKITTFTKHNNTVRSAIFCRNDLVATAGGHDNAVYLWDVNSGEVKIHIIAKGRRVDSVALGNGLTVAFGNTWGGGNGSGPLERSFDFSEMILNQHIPIETDDFKRSQTEYQSKTLEQFSYYELQIADGKTIVHDRSIQGRIHSYTFTKDGNIVVGSSNSLKLYSPDGRCLRDFIGHTGEVMAVAISEDGKILASASTDQTIKLWNLTAKGEFPSFWEHSDPSSREYLVSIGMEDLAKQRSRDAWGKIISRMKSVGDANYQIIEQALSMVGDQVLPLATLFVSSDGEWICWTPQGYYAASAGGEKYIGWHLNQGIDKAARYYPVSVFRKRFHHPELVKRTIVLKNFDQALIEINAESRQNIEETTITQILPPQVRWVLPKNVITETSRKTIRIRAELFSDSQIEEVKVLINGRTQELGRGLVVVEEEKRDNVVINCEVPLTVGNNEIVVFAANENAGTTSDKRTIICNARDREDWLKSNLYMVSIGISIYQQRDLQLEYADDDAKAISRLFLGQEGKLYRKVIIKELYNESATRGNIIDALEWLENQTTQKDVAMIFIAAHGQKDKRGQYYLLSTDSDQERLRRTGVAWVDFVDILGNLPSRVLLFLDTCHSGQLGQNLFRLRGKIVHLSPQMDTTEAVRELTSDENGVVIMAASTGRESSIEHPQWGHGAFTMALLDGLERGQADYSRDGVIHLRELDMYVAERVKELTLGFQHPTTVKPSTISRFPIVHIK